MPRIRGMNYARFLTATSAARKACAIRVVGESRPHSPRGPRGAAPGSARTWHGPGARSPRTRLQQAGQQQKQQDREDRLLWTRPCYSPGGSSLHGSLGFAQRAGACGGGGPCTGEKGAPGSRRVRGFLLLWPSTCLPDHSAFLVGHLYSLVPPPVRQIQKELSCFSLASYQSLEIVQLQSFIDDNATG